MPCRDSRAGALRASSLIGTLIVLTVLIVAAPADTAIAETRTPPSSPARMIAEWEPAWGTIIRWPLGFPMDLAVELAEDDTLYTLVEGAYNENQARNAFTNAGIDMDHVRFIRTQTYSMWTRDWGPQCVFGSGGQMGIADPWFDGYPWVPGCSSKSAGRTGTMAALSGASPSGGTAMLAVGRDGIPRVGTRGYEEDDAINADVATALGLPLHELPAYCTGGNIMTDGHHRAFSTEQMLDENAPYMSHGTFYARTEDYLGITDYQILPNPEVHGIQHTDCYAKLLDPETVLVKEVPSWHPEYDCCEDLVTHFQSLTTCYGRPYEIVRIFCDSYSGNDVAAYTNSLILNGKVLVPTFGVSSDAAALQTYQEAMPGYEVIGFYYSSWYSYDALHCRTMAIFDAGMLRLSHAPLPDVVPAAAEHEIAVVVEPMSGAALVPGTQLIRWRLEGESTWNDSPLAPARAETLTGTIPGQTPGDVVEYYVTASDQSGRTETLPRTAPDWFYSFQIDPASGVPSEHAAPGALALAAHPSPFRDSAALSFVLPRPQLVTLAVHDVAGRVVAVLHDGQLAAGTHDVVWNGRASTGTPAVSGVYFARLCSAESQATTKLILLR